MKQWIIVTIIILTIILNIKVASAYQELGKDTTTPLDSYCQKCNQDINVIDEVKEQFDEEPVPVGLDECVAIALQNNFNIKVTNSIYKSANYDYKNSLAQIFMPNVGLKGYSIYYAGEVLVGAALIENFHELALSGSIFVSHDLTKGGQQIFDSRAAKFQARSDLKTLDQTKNDIMLQTSISYYQLLQQKLSIEVYLKNLYERTAQLKLTETQWQAGIGTKFDVIRSKTEQAQAEQKLMIALYEFRKAQAKLANVMGIEVKTGVVPIEDEVIEYNLVDENLTIDDLYEVARSSRDDIKSIENIIKSLKEQKMSVYSEFIPKARVIYEHQYQGTAAIGMFQNNIVGAYLDIPLGEKTGVGTVTKAKSVQSKIDAQCYNLTQKLRNIRESIVSNFYNAGILKKRVNIARDQVDYATESVKLAELRMEAGEGILIDVIQAQTWKTNARIELLTTIVEYNINQIRLLYDNGTISYENIIKNYKP